MKVNPTGYKRPFVSASARQRRKNDVKSTTPDSVVNEALRDLEQRAVYWPAALTHAVRVPTTRDELCAAYLREAAGSELLLDALVRTQDHAFLVVRAGELVVETAQGPLAVKQGDSVIIAAGWFRLTELPPAHSSISYWVFFVGPGFLQSVFGDATAARQAAMQVAPVYRGAYVQRRLLLAMARRGIESPVPNVEQTFQAVVMLTGASIFMFLREHYYIPRDELLQLALTCLKVCKSVEEIGLGWPGGIRAFRRNFELYHGVRFLTWARREQNKSRRARLRSEPDSTG